MQHKGPKKARVRYHDTYLPDEEEITARAKELRWLQGMGFSSRFICNVMRGYLDIKVVRAAITHGVRPGVIETQYDILLEPTEYDRPCHIPETEKAG
jgi:hypothetical protein